MITLNPCYEFINKANDALEAQKTADSTRWVSLAQKVFNGVVNVFCWYGENGVLSPDDVTKAIVSEDYYSLEYIEALATNENIPPELKFDLHDYLANRLPGFAFGIDKSDWRYKAALEHHGYLVATINGVNRKAIL